MESHDGALTSIEAVIFDLDGTLIDSGADIAASANQVRRAFALAPVPETVAVGYVGDGVAKLLRRILSHDLASGRTGAAGRPVTDPELTAAHKIFREHYGAHCLDQSRLYPGIRELLHALRDRHLLLATNKPRVFTDQILQGLDIADVFERVVAGDETPARKPDPAHLTACLVGLDIRPENVAVVGDNPNDVRAARAFGAVAVAVSYGLTGVERLREAGPDYLVGSVRELAACFE